MGIIGDKMTSTSADIAGILLKSLSHIGAIRSKKMFGGYGVFEEDTMFALIDKAGTVFFKADDTLLKKFEDAGSEKHGRMPYYQVPDVVLADTAALIEWAQASIVVAKKPK